MNEIYISVDIEADGPIPGENSMLSFGAIALRRDGTELGEFYKTLYPLEYATQDARTMGEFWAKQPEAWEEVNSNRTAPQVAMQEYQKWLKMLGGRPIQSMYPAGFDFTFIRWYMCKFVKPNWDFSALDMKTMAMVLLGTTYQESYKRNFPKSWLSKNDFPHHALEDARAQGHMLVQMFANMDEKTMRWVNMIQYIRENTSDLSIDEVVSEAMVKYGS